MEMDLGGMAMQSSLMEAWMNYAAIMEARADQFSIIIKVHRIQKSRHVRMQLPSITSQMEAAETPTSSLITVLKPISSQTSKATNAVWGHQLRRQSPMQDSAWEKTHSVLTLETIRTGRHPRPALPNAGSQMNSVFQWSVWALLVEFHQSLTQSRSSRHSISIHIQRLFLWGQVRLRSKS